MSKHIVSIGNTIEQLADNYANVVSKAALATLTHPDNLTKMQQLAEEIAQANANGNKVVFMGIGKNSYLCHKLAATCQSLNIQANYFDAVHAVHGDLGILRPGDVLVSFSNSGTTHELLQTVKYIFDNNDKFLVTQWTVHKDKPVMPIDKYVYGNQTRHALRTIHLFDCDEADDAKTVPTTSAVIMQMIGDVIALKVAELEMLTTEQFGLTHPGGNIGATINN